MDQRAAYVFKPAGEKDFNGIALDMHMHKEDLRYQQRP